MTSTHALAYRREVDGLRAIAILPVILFHAGAPGFRGGFIGVDVFFVISGYLITSILIREAERGRFSIYEFYERRARRILPALYFMLFVSCAVAWLGLMPRDLKDFVNSLLATLTFTSNHFFSHQRGYFDTAAELKPLLHTWSLSVEEQFYLLFPFGLALLLKKGRRFAWFAVAGVGLLSLGLAQYKVFGKPVSNFYLLPTRGWELLIGSALALYAGRPSRSEFGAAVGLGLSIAACFQFDSSTPFPGVYGLIPTLGTALLIQCATEQTFVGRLLALRPVVFVGLLSYSLYLWHQPVLAFTRLIDPGAAGPLLVLWLCGATALPAFLSWRYVERPFRAGGGVSVRRLWQLLGGASVALALLALVMTATNDSAWRISENPRAGGGDVGQDPYYEFLAEKYTACEQTELREQAPRLGRFERCKQTRPGKAEVTLIGDSMAEQLFSGLSENFEKINFVYYIDNPDLPADIFAYGVPNLEVGAYKKIFESLAQPGSSRILIMTTHYIERFPHAETRAREMERMKAAVLKMLDLGKEVVLVGNVPSFETDASLCKFKTYLRTDFRCEITRELFERHENLFRELRDKIGPRRNLEFVEIGERFCDSEKCSMILDGTLMYRDQNHLNLTGSRFVGRILEQKSEILRKLKQP